MLMSCDENKAYGRFLDVFFRNSHLFSCSAGGCLLIAYRNLVQTIHLVQHTSENIAITNLKKEKKKTDIKEWKRGRKILTLILQIITSAWPKNKTQWIHSDYFRKRRRHSFIRSSKKLWHGYHICITTTFDTEGKQSSYSTLFSISNKKRNRFSWVVLWHHLNPCWHRIYVYVCVILLLSRLTPSIFHAQYLSSKSKIRHQDSHNSANFRSRLL
jgi:hypothetical protein